MKLGFWTRGMPPWDNATLATKAAALGYDGVDLRCTQREGGIPSDDGNVALDATDAEITSIVSAFADAGVTIASLLCYNHVADAGSITSHEYEIGDWRAYTDDAVAHMRLAARLGTDRVRLTVGRPADGVRWTRHLSELWRATSAALDEVPGMRAVYENHPGSANAEDLLKMAEFAQDPRIGLELAPDHCIVMQEDLLALVDRYAEHIHQVCFSDRRPVEEDLARFDGRYYHVRYETVWNGDGIVPAARLFERLAASGFDGYVSLKWEKSDNYGHELPDGELALEHFPDFIRQFGVQV